MEYNSVTNIESCYYGISKLVYYAHIPTGIIALLMGIFVFWKNKNLLGKILFSISIIFSLFLLSNLTVWINTDSRIVMFAWSMLGSLRAIISLLFLYFLYVFINKKDVSFKLKIISLFLVLPLIFLVHTRYNLEMFNIPNCEAKENPYYVSYYYGLSILVFIWILVYGSYKYIKEKTEFRKQILFLLIGIESFLFLFVISGFIASYLAEKGIDYAFEIEEYGLFGMTFFMGALAYLIVKFNAFNIKLLGVQALIVSQIIIIASMLTFATSSMNRILISITIALTTAMGWSLVRSVKKEVALREALEISSAELAERKDELQMMADRLSQSNAKLRKLDNAKSEFISIASHQLRTPLTAIKGFVSLLLEGSYGKVEAKQVDVLNKIYTSNERLVLLVEDLLNVSRMESGRMEFKFANCQLDGVCQEVFDTFVLRAKEHELSFEYIKPAKTVPEVMVDSTKVREVISNLVDNALKYTPDNHGGVTLKLEQLGENIRVTVSDSGIGIPDTELPYLFAKFSRGKDVSRLNVGGTGLGLYVGRGMIESNGGKIWAESDGTGLGSRFIFEIPIVQSEELLKRWG